MPIKILMPALSPTMTAGNLTKWLKQEGELIKAGEVIAEIETDKATMEVEAVDEGKIAKILVAAGTENVPVGNLIAVILEEDEDASALDSFIESNATKTSVNSNAPEVKQETEKVVPVLEVVKVTQQNQGRILASPLAKRIAADKGINLQNITGTGPRGRIVKSDLESMQSNPVSGVVNRNPLEYSTKSNNNMRKVIATRLALSKQSIPHFYLNIECNLDKLLEARADINDAANNGSYKLSVNDLVIKAVALALRDVPSANASWDEQNTIFYNNVDVSVAVAIDDGLITPIVRNADQKSLVSISNEMKSLAQKAKDGKLSPEEYQGGGFTISNLGMYGIHRFNAIINPPQSCILAVGAGVKRPIVDKNDQIKVATIMDVTLSCDHRVVDGAVGANFLAAFKNYIEHPVKMLI
ncbi:MAG UNVERIFIED_CONTAM: pyruvate dehydrogenase complex dihydrolipoamide acetyltransferase [Rickettsiaceae bacterium]|jgi:pyruvate dehydrogenase E2 component (dihydrolipoamide acetyltransferase)